ncbi:MAG: Flp pilus assembly protein TadD [Oceanospirillaceae bacterium]|jgi:Flp pilus assembly protein TadD
MNKIFRLSRLIITAFTLLVLAGCSVSGVNSVSIEDRSITGNSNNRANSVIEQSEEVEVTALNIRPNFKTFNTQVVNEGVNENSNVRGIAAENVTERANSQINQQSKAPEIPVRAQKPATIALLNTANYQTNNGSLRAAQSSLERALRISPKDPEVYQSLGEVHRLLGEYVQAEQITLKGISLAAGQSNKLRRLWSALAKIRSESGDTAGANKAFQKSQSY